MTDTALALVNVCEISRELTNSQCLDRRGCALQWSALSFWLWRSFAILTHDIC